MFIESAPADTSAVLIADDHALVRAGVRAVVARVFPDAIVLEVSDGESLMRTANAVPSTRLAVVGARMTGLNAGAVLLELARRRPELPIVVVSAIDACQTVRRSLGVPTVFSVLHRGADVDDLRVAIEAAVKGHKIGYLRSVPGNHVQSILTPRQEEVHRLLRQGMSNKLIASTLGISVGTVKNHMSEIFKLLNTSNRTQAAQLDPGTL